MIFENSLLIFLIENRRGYKDVFVKKYTQEIFDELTNQDVIKIANYSDIGDGWCITYKARALLHKNLLRYVKENKSGKVKDLENMFTKDMVKSSMLTGELKPVVVENFEQGWQFTKRGEEWYKFIFFEELYKPTLFERFVNWSNKIILKL